MVEITKVDDVNIGLEASNTEWQAIKAIINYAFQNYWDTDLEYANFTREGIGDLLNEFNKMKSPPLKMHYHTMLFASLVIGFCQDAKINGIEKTKIHKIIDDLDKFKFHKEFPRKNKGPGLKALLAKLNKTSK